MKIVKWVEQADGCIAWVSGGHTLGKAYPVDGVWRTSWYGEPGSKSGCLTLLDGFSTAYDACMAAEKRFPSPVWSFSGWLQSKNGGYFRKFNKRTVYVRKTENGWYAVQTDGKLLGKGGGVSWFATAVDACQAVEKEKYTPIDADPFVNTCDQLHWIKFRTTVRAA
jgi:hypothetical protein